MRIRAVSSVWVVAVGLLPAVFGGPVFAAAMALLGGLGYREYQAMATGLGARPPAIGYAVVAAFAVVPLAGGGEQAALGVVAAAVGFPLLAVVLRADATGAFVGWALSVAGAFYVGVPVFAAVALRGTGGHIDAGWLADLADGAATGWDAAPRGLAWLVVVLLVTWLGDTGAYLVGRAWGRRPLLPRVSPKKTVEGAIGGLAGSALAAGLGVEVVGLGVNPLLGAAIGAGLGALGQLGDLAESLLKRQVGVKDSGALIPGHGGVLDRIDALLFTLTAGWFVSTIVDGAVR